MDSEDEKSVNGSEQNDIIDDNNEVDSMYSSGDDESVITEGDTDLDIIGEENNNIIMNESDANDNSDDDDDDEDDEDNQEFYEKIEKDSEIIIEKHHPESIFHNYDEIRTLSNVVRDKNNKIIDPFHKTLPILTKYEKARILGQRAKQIENNSRVFVNLNETIVDSYVIAELELKAKKIPFIIKRPLPGGTCEYWRVQDLEILGF